MGLPHRTSSKVMGRFKTHCFIALFLGCQGLFLLHTAEASTSAGISSQFERDGFDSALGGEQGQPLQFQTEDSEDLEDEYAIKMKRNSDEMNSHSGWKRHPYGYGLGKRDPYGYGLGKREPYGYGLGKRAVYAYGLGKREPYGYGLGKRDPYGYGFGKRQPYGYGLGKRAVYAYGLGKREPYGYGL